MTVPYQFIIAGLPDILFEEKKIGIDLHTLIEEISELIPQSHVRYLKIIGYPVDNRNLMRILQGENDPGIRIGNYSESSLKEEIKNPDSLPDYMQEFLNAYQAREPLVQGLSWENQLQWLFYEQVTVSENRFLAEWFTFELHLRNILTAIKCRRSKGPAESHLICQNEITDLLLKSSASDFGLPAKMHWTDDLFAIDLHDIPESEKYLDRLRLQQLEEIPVPDCFCLETVLKIGIAVDIIDRWNRLDNEAGKEILENMIHQLEADYQSE